MEELKKLINLNKEISKVLENCTDDFLLANKSTILIALDDEGTFEGYKIKITVNDDILEWEYIPFAEKTKHNEEIHLISLNYTYKLPDEWKKYYLIDLNDINWTNDKKNFANVCKTIIKNTIDKKNSKGFWLYGISNSGKTFSTIALLNMLAKNGSSVAFVNIPDLIAKTQGSFKNPDDESFLNINRIKKADFVVIDDLGSERPTPWFKESILLPIIDFRLKADKTTIFTSNFDIKKYGNKLKYRSQNPEVEKDTNDKIISRLRDLTSQEIKLG